MSVGGEGRHYQVGGLRFRLEPERSDLDALLPTTFSGFLADPGAPPHYRVILEEAEDLAADPLSFFLPHRFEVAEAGERFRFINRHERVKRLGEIDPAEGEARLRLPPEGVDLGGEEVASAVSTGLSDFLKSCLQIFLLREGGTLLHACGVSGEGKGFLLMGPTGAGKSTAALLLRKMDEVSVLNDDLVALRPADDGWELWGTPWSGSKGGVCSPGSALLTAVFSLRRGEGSGAEPLERKEALRELLANLPWIGEGESLTHSTMSAAAALAAAAPFFRLTFRLEDSLWELLKGSAGSG